MKLFNRSAKKNGAKEPRTVASINNEYAHLCAQVGERDFQISVLAKQKADIYQQMHNLGNEMQLAQAKEAKEREAAAAAAKEEPKSESA